MYLVRFLCSSFRKEPLAELVVKWSCLTWVTLVCGFRWTVHGAQLLLQQLCSSCLTGLSQNTPHSSSFFLNETPCHILYYLKWSLVINDLTLMLINSFLFRMMLKWIMTGKFKPCIYNFLLCIKVAVVKLFG